MRKLAILACAFSAAVFGANFLLPEGAWAPAGGALALVFPLLLFLWSRRRERRRLALVLACGGLSAGLLWTAAYTAVFFQPARDMDDRTVRMAATVSDWPRQTEYGWSVPVRADAGPCGLSAVLYTDSQGADLRPGDRISTVAHCTLGDRTLSGEEITYYTAKGIFLQAQAYGRLTVERPGHIPAAYWAAVYARRLKEGIDRVFPGDVSPLLKALVTGNRDSLTDQFTTSLERTGLSHTVAVSGMHLAFLSSLAAGLLGRGKRSTALVTAVWVVLFCGVAGNTPSVTRAAVMILMLQAAPLLRRERDGPTALAFALMLLLLWNPFSAAHLGLQLSFGAVAGILVVSDRVQDWLTGLLRLDKRVKGRVRGWLLALPRFFVSVLSATAGAMVLTVPLTALHFKSFSLVAPLSNLMTLWAVAILFLSGLILGTLGIFLPGPAAVLAVPFTALARYLEWVVDALGRMTLAALPLDSPYYRAWLVFIYLLMGAAAVVRGKKRLIFPLGFGTVALCISLMLTSADFQSGVMAVSALDVGQGQSVLVRMGRDLILVDCGGDGPDNAGDVAADYIQSAGRSDLELLVVSHFHADHANGVPQLLRRLQVKNLALPDVEEDDPLRREILALAEEQETQVWLIRSDTSVQWGNGQSITLYPPLGRGTQTNELGLTVLATAESFDALITGDMGGEVEPLLLDHGDLPDIELLVVGHHGSRYATTQELLAAVKPELAVISVGRNNRYGHPAQETLERLDAAGAEIYRTDLHGTIKVEVGG